MCERHILICAGTGCISSGTISVKDALENELKNIIYKIGTSSFRDVTVF